jgi:hypothetical protein
MKLTPLSTVLAVAIAVAGSSAFADELTMLRADEPKPLQYFIFDESVHNFPVMTEEEFRKWNPQFADASLNMVVPAWTPIMYDQNADG